MRDTGPAAAGGADTIAAIATPEGEGGIAVVRVSGPGALAVARSLFTPASGRPATLATHRAVFGLIHARAGAPLDEGLLLPMLAPNSYTGEDTVEFHCHGGRFTARRVLGACLEAGARAAGPGEFTRRAFLGGRLSLDQAEAVADLIHAEDELAAAGALEQLRGALRREVEEIERPLRALLTEVEGALEFAQEEKPGARARAVDVVRTALARTEALLALAPAARRVREGVRVVLVGPPNSGKSALFNALLGRARAIVDAAPGTTRDVITEALHHGGLSLVLHDTAGLRARGGRVEALGMTRARSALDTADIVVWVHDLSAAAGQWERPAAPVGAAELGVGTKADLASPQRRAAEPAMRATSAVTGEGIEARRDALVAAADAGGLRRVARMGLLLGARHQSRLMECQSGLRAVLQAFEEEGAGDEVAATLLGGALAQLGEISGRVFTEALLGDVFSRFCIGK